MHSKIKRRRAFAIVVTLLMLSLLTVLITSFYFKSSTDLKSTMTRSRLQIAEMTSKSIQTLVISDILNELAHYSKKTTDHGKIYLRPNSDQESFLNRISIPSFLPDFLMRRSDEGFERGRIRDFRLGEETENGATRGSLTENYWKRYFGEETDLRLGTPRWRYLPSEEGNKKTAFSKNEKRKRVTRFAFHLYQLDGMIDPNGLPVQNTETKKTSDILFSKIDFSKIGLKSMSQWLQWRYPSSQNDQGLLKGTLEDSLTIKQKNRTFLGRSDFLSFFNEHSGLFNLSQIHLWTHMNIQRNIPTFKPARITGSQVDYSADSLKDKIENPDFLNIRVKKPFVRRNGQTATIGEPLVTQRFPLQYTLWLDSSSGITVLEDQLFSYFGLKKDPKNDDSWIYREGQNKIYTLSEVADQNREPDFFELLKAGIMRGSIGEVIPKSSIYPSYLGGMTNGPFCILTQTDLEPYLYADSQIMKIGVNLIDQYDQNSYVTRVTFSKDKAGNGMVFYGQENLPYITRLILIASRYGSGSDSLCNGYLASELWFPHDQTVPLTKSDTPTEFKLVILGEANVQTYAPDTSITQRSHQLNSEIVVTNLADFKGLNPKMLYSTNSTSTDANSLTPGSQQYTSFHIGTEAVNPMIGGSLAYWGLDSPTLKISLYYKRNGKWIPYDELLNAMVQSGIGGIPPSSVSSALYDNGIFTVSRLDSRTLRYGFSRYDTRDPYPYDFTMLPSLSAVLPNSAYAPTNVIPQVPSTPSQDGYTFAIPDYLKNNPSTGSYYKDPDGVVRKADCFFMKTELENPLSASTTYGRPVVLNTPFTSEGDLGAVYRDTPYRSLDFFSKESADLGLLDIFSIKDLPYRRDQINFNFSDPKVIQALLGNTALHPTIASRGTIPSGVAETVATQFSEYVRSGNQWKNPITNRAQLLTQFAETWGQLTGSGIKIERESIFRRLIPFLSCNTWNLGLDLVVQVGDEVEVNGTKKFLMESQFKSWVTLVVDPYTAEVLHQESEPFF